MSLGRGVVPGEPAEVRRADWGWISFPAPTPEWDFSSLASASFCPCPAEQLLEVFPVDQWLYALCLLPPWQKGLGVGEPLIWAGSDPVPLLS